MAWFESPAPTLPAIFPESPGVEDQRQRQQSSRHEATSRAEAAGVVGEWKVSGNTCILALDQAGEFRE